MHWHLHFIVVDILFACRVGDAAQPLTEWPKVALPEPAQVQLKGATGAALDRGIARLAQAPYTTEWLLADVSFKINRIFTNYSGDVSGRFIELAALTSPARGFAPPTLQPVLSEIARYQKPDGHFGLEIVHPQWKAIAILRLITLLDGPEATTDCVEKFPGQRVKWLTLPAKTGASGFE